MEAATILSMDAVDGIQRRRKGWIRIIVCSGTEDIVVGVRDGNTRSMGLPVQWTMVYINLEDIAVRRTCYKQTNKR